MNLDKGILKIGEIEIPFQDARIDMNNAVDSLSGTDISKIQASVDKAVKAMESVSVNIKLTQEAIEKMLINHSPKFKASLIDPNGLVIKEWDVAHLEIYRE